MYFLDANILISANRTHFPLTSNRQQFWMWMLKMGEERKICIPESVYEELAVGHDDLIKWLMTNKKSFFISKQAAFGVMPEVMSAYVHIFGHDMAFPEGVLETLKADPYIVAHAKTSSGVVVTDEIANNKLMLNYKSVKIPAVCKFMGIHCITFVQFMWELRKTLPQ